MPWQKAAFRATKFFLTTKVWISDAGVVDFGDVSFVKTMIEIHAWIWLMGKLNPLRQQQVMALHPL